MLGAYPDEDEGLAKPAWLKFVTLGEPDKSFVEFPDQVWAFVKRGPYAAFSVAEAGTRPGILVDQMEQVLLAAEEGRTRSATRCGCPTPQPRLPGKPRTSLHPPAGKPQPEEVESPRRGRRRPELAGRARSPPTRSPSLVATAARWRPPMPPLTACRRAARRVRRRRAAETGRGAQMPGASALTKEPKKLASAGTGRERRRRGRGRPGPSGQRVLGIASGGLGR